MTTRAVTTAAALMLSGTALAQDGNIGVLHATDVTCGGSDVTASIGTTGRTQTQVAVDVSGTTPTLANLAPYDAVLVYNDGRPFADPDALGDVLADYVDTGGGVVIAGGALMAPTAIGGRFAAENYSPFTLDGTFLQGEQHQLVFDEPSHPTLRFVARVYGGPDSTHAGGLEVVNPSVQVASWSDGEPFVAYKVYFNRGNVVALNFLPISSDCMPNEWYTATDAEHLLTSSLLWTVDLMPVCLNTTLVQDINCNSIDYQDEAPVDLTDPLCLQLFNSDGFDNQDYYYQYPEFGCQLPVPLLPQANPNYPTPPDADEDGFSAHSGFALPENVEDPFGGPGAGNPTLPCDNCPNDFNPEQRDGDCDNIGDICDICPTYPDPAQDPLQQTDNDCQGQCPDGVGDACDNCLLVANPDQSDIDFDVLGDVCDNCPEIFNPDQLDGDNDQLGDECDNCDFVENPDQADGDMDEVGDVCDNCPEVPNTGQANSDGDVLGDGCDNCRYVDNVIIEVQGEDIFISQLDEDGDGVGDDCDTCLDIPNSLQLDDDIDLVGNACDNCVDRYNPSQADEDGDGVGNACDNCKSQRNARQRDTDGDQFGDLCDNCPLDFNFEQRDRDGDGIGDVCDVCPLVPDAVLLDGQLVQYDSDGDGVGDACDNCKNLANIDQLDEDQNGVGDVCDIQVRGGGENYEIACSHTRPGPGGLALLLGLMAMGTRRTRKEA